MSDTAQDYQKLLNDAIRKQKTILGPQITLLKVRNVKGLTVESDGTVKLISDTPINVITSFLEQFRDLSSPLVKKTMQPLLSVIGQKVNDTDTRTLLDQSKSIASPFPNSEVTNDQSISQDQAAHNPELRHNEQDTLVKN